MRPAPEVLAGEDGLQTVLNRDDISAVTVVLPIYLQAGYSLRAIKAGKHVLSEKPIAGSTEEAESVIREWKETSGSIHYCIAENYRFEKAFREAASGVKEVCGGVISASITAFVPFPEGSKYESTQWYGKLLFLRVALLSLADLVFVFTCMQEERLETPRRGPSG
uniref:Gfo/Idh/MocA-like oxidoreductase N-terminal domain-containing protein n=1 Tax=Rhodosorus marinus TaxID=101924 RepID=A0A7S2ZHK3_9RHOD|mmetsp:Transcript_198/g.449  ORF Transcript_198/g.449 Transcript_198/m.449 type:complete len:165 (+) Transcript_198:451-945(+)